MAGKSINDVLFRFVGDTRSLDRATKKAKGDFSSTQKSAGGLQGALGKLRGMVGPLMAAFGATQLAGFALDAIKAGEKAEIAAESLDKVLGPSADDLRERFDELRLVMGFSKGEFDSMSTSLGMLLTSQGIAASDAALMVGDLIEIGGNLAAFSPSIGTAEQAVSDLTGAIRGEFDPLEKWGIKLSAAKIKAEKARLDGLDPLFKSLSDGEQDLKAVTSLVERGAAPAMDALGDAAETAAGKTAILATKVEDLREEVGQELLPVYNDMLELMLEVTPALQGVTGAVRESLGPFTMLIGLAKDLKNPMDAVKDSAGMSAKEMARQAFNITKYLNPALWAMDYAMGVVGPNIDETTKSTEDATEATDDYALALGQVPDNIPGIDGFNLGLANTATEGGDAAAALGDVASAAGDAEGAMRGMNAMLDIFSGNMFGKAQALRDAAEELAAVERLFAGGGGSGQTDDPVRTSQALYDSGSYRGYAP